MELITMGISLLIVAGILGVGFWLVPFLKSKGYLNDKSMADTDQLMQLANIIVKNLDFKDDKVENTVKNVFAVSEVVVKYVEQTLKNQDNAAKKDYAVNAVKDILTKVGVVVTADIEQLIEIGIESAVNSLPKTNDSNLK
jgi:hypothetical protein